MTSVPHFSRSVSRRGLTFLEMVFASALLALVAAGAFSTIGFVGNMHKREQQTLGAAELASSMIIQYLDDKNGLPSQISPVDYGPWQYRYTIREDRVTFRPARTRESSNPAARTLSIDRIKQVTVKVWLTEEREGGESDSEIMPSFEITRILDPLALRNPDSFKNMMESDSLRRQFGDEVTGGVGGLPPPPGSTNPGTRRAPPPPPGTGPKPGGGSK